MADISAMTTIDQILLSGFSILSFQTFHAKTTSVATLAEERPWERGCFVPLSSQLPRVQIAQNAQSPTETIATQALAIFDFVIRCFLSQF